MNTYKLLIFVLLLLGNTIKNNLIAQCVAYSYTAPTASISGNPRGITSTSTYTLGSTTYTFGGDNSTSGWSSVSFPSLGSSNTSNEVTIPSGFSFSFYNEAVTGFKVSYNGIVQLIGPSETSTGVVIRSSSFTTSDNASLPSSLLPDNSICIWDVYSSAGNVYYGFFQSSGITRYKQLWIKFKYMFGGNAYWFAIVLEESTNNIYCVDMAKSTTMGALATTATMGIQRNNTTAAMYSANVAMSSTATTSNKYYKFTSTTTSTRPSFFTGALSYSTTTLPATEKYYDKTDYSCLTAEVENAKLKVKLDVGNYYTLGTTPNYTISLPVTVTAYNSSCTSLGSYSQTITLDGSTANIEAEKLAVIELNPLSGTTVNYTDVDYYGILFGSITAASGTTTPSQLRIRAWFDEDYEVDVNSNGYDATSMINLSTVSTEGNRVSFSWTSDCNEVDDFELQLLRIYNTDEDATYSENENAVHNSSIDWGTAFSIEVKDATTYNHIVAEGTGYYAWRVRPIGDYYEGGIANSQNWGSWSTHSRTEQADDFSETASSTLPKYIFFITQPESDYNWIFNQIFTEGNRHAENMTYADGLLRVKQSQHHLQSTDQYITTETMYDYIGRKALQTLAAPISNTYFSYQSNFIPSDFDESDFDDADAGTYTNPSSITSGLLLDYYDNSTDLTLPTSTGYPFSQTQYVNDGTNRVQETSSVGSTHKIGGSHTTKVYFSQVGDDELVDVFADQTPNSDVLYKTTIIDPNGEGSVTYSTIDGKTIATCLAETGNENNLERIASAANATKTISVNTGAYTMIDDYTMIKQAQIGLSTPSAVQLTYVLNPSEIEAECGDFCSTCDYIATITLTNDATDEEITLLGNETTLTIAASDCGTLSEQTLNFYTDEQNLLDIGTYTGKVTMKVYNDDPLSTTDQTYLEEHQDNRLDDITTATQTFFDDLETALTDAETEEDITLFYDYLTDAANASLFSYSINGDGTISEGNNITITPIDVECCSLELPVLICPPHPCDENPYPDYESLLLDYGTHGPYPYNYFYNVDGSKLYPLGGTIKNSYITLGSAPFTVSDDAILNIGVIGSDGIKQPFFPDPIVLDYGANLGSDLVQELYRQLTAQFTSDYGSDQSNWPYLFSVPAFAIYRDQFHIQPNIEYGTTTDAQLYVEPEGFSINDVMAEFEYFQSDAYFAGLGAFNQLMWNAINDGYDCKNLWDATQAALQSFDNFQFDESGDLLPVSLMDAIFGSAGGMMYSSITTQQDSYTDEAEYSPGTTSYGPSLPLHYYETFYYQPGTATVCETQYGLDATLTPDQWGDTTADGVIDVDWSADILTEDTEDKTWYNFYSCQLSSNTDYYAAFEDFAAEHGLDISTDCITASDNIEESCNEYCENRSLSFENSLRSLYESEITAGTITDDDIACMTNDLIQLCKDGCQLDVQYDTYGNCISIGTDAQIQSITQAFTYTYNIEKPISGSCSSGYMYKSSSIDAQIIDLLNEALDAFAPTPIFVRLNYVDIQNMIVDAYTDLGYEYDDCILEIPLTFFTNVNNSSSFKVDASSKMISLEVGFSSTNIFDLDRFTYCYHQCEVCMEWVDMSTYTTPDPIEFEPNTCPEVVAGTLRSLIAVQKYQCKENYKNDIVEQYENTCANPDSVNDQLTLTYSQGLHHYTLYYYDVAGNLVSTVPPGGVEAHEAYTDRNTPSEDQEHLYKTIYTYNSLGQLTSKTTPDGGETNFWYNAIGQIRYSQNAQQLLDNTYSYVKYDELGRIVEAGVSTGNPEDYSSDINDNSFPSSGTEIMYTVFSESANDADIEQEYLQNRVSYAISDVDGDILTTTDQVKTIFSYDPHGNVNKLLQNIPGLGKKLIEFEYDLISNNVSMVMYNRNHVDQNFVRYTYDEDNRITQSESSRDSLVWSTDVSYEYYAHGPLKRKQLGHDQIQGIDYIYTIHGWLKAINHPDLTTTNDPGQDGGLANRTVAKDAFGMTLEYFSGDFNRAGSPYNNTATTTSGIYYGNTIPSLYNGCITETIFNNKLSTTTSSGQKYAQKPLRFDFSMDQLNRIVQSAFSYYASSAWTARGDFAELLSYDANGNILTNTRKGNSFGSGTTASTSNLKMDQLTYHYADADNNGIADNNQLQYISDAVAASGAGADAYSADLSDQATTNYAYNANGQLTQDEAESISNISWTATGLVKTVTKTDGTTIDFMYDALNNRVSKQTTSASSTTTYYYVKGPKGNVMATYQSDGTTTNLIEKPIGTNRVGLDKYTVDAGATYTTSNTGSRIVGNKYFENTDHLGNVRVVVSDIKTSAGSGTYIPIIVSANDYYTYGSELPGRTYSSEAYRYGFNGMEKDDELKNSSGTSYDFGARIYDTRVGRWLSTDPLEYKYPSESPYEAMGNNPLIFIDPQGKSLALALFAWISQAHAPASDQEVTTAQEQQRQLRVITLAIGSLSLLPAGISYMEGVAIESLGASVAGRLTAQQLIRITIAEKLGMGALDIYMGLPTTSAVLATSARAAGVYLVGGVGWDVAEDLASGKEINIDWPNHIQSAIKEGAQATVGLVFEGGRAIKLTGGLAIEYLNDISAQMKEGRTIEDIDHSRALSQVIGLVIAQGIPEGSGVTREVLTELAENRIQDVTVAINEERKKIDWGLLFEDVDNNTTQCQDDHPELIGYPTCNETPKNE